MQATQAAKSLNLDDSLLECPLWVRRTDAIQSRCPRGANSRHRRNEIAPAPIVIERRHLTRNTAWFIYGTPNNSKNNYRTLSHRAGGHLLCHRCNGPIEPKTYLEENCQLKTLSVYRAVDRFTRPTLALFLVPLILLEPVKPFSAYLVTSGHLVFGMLVLVLGEVLKITIVERIFHIGRDKLMTIKAFAWSYNFVSGWLAWVQSLPPWQATKQNFADFIHWMHKLKHDGRAREFR